ncbi:phage tail protein [Cohnella abietis]|uniref:Uncharacterized protein n=1 Tax=Cohnella abietis TaxID=2507935 RepID=A0A3T1D2P1_9BACL|nr:hypothetical protein [Cohnella abietis]BBI32370.1 hypothetical protein KCTCHS21_17690 [Cohnella abietis]
MSASVGQVDLDLGLNYSKFDKQLNGISSTATNKVGGAFKKLAVIIGGAFAIKKMFDFGKSAVAAADEVAVSETKLTTIMRQRMGATDAAIQSVKDLTAAQEALGVVDAASQIAGAQELSTYLEYSSTLKTLIPVINDLSAQQYGLNASSGQVVGMATMVGKVMDGQVGALSRYGFTFDAAQEKILKYGNEAQRAALLAEIVKDSLGDMNAALGATPEGKMKQLSFTLGAIKEEIGRGIKPMLQAVLPYIQAVANAFLKAAQYATAFSNAIFGTNKAVTASAGVAAKAEAGMGEAVKKAGKKVKNSLNSFDELNVITQATADNMDGIAGADVGGVDLGGAMPDLTPEIDTSRFQPFLDMLSDIKNGAISIAQYFATEFGPPIQTAIDSLLVPLHSWKTTLWDTFNEIGGLGEPFKAWLSGDLVPYMKLWIVTAGDLWAGLLESAETVFKDIKDAVMPILSWFVTDGLPLVTNFATGALIIFKSIFDGVKHIFDTLWSEGVKPGLDLVSKIIVDTLGIIKGFWDTFGGDIVEGIQKAIDGVVSIFDSLWEGFLKPIWDNLIKGMTWLWEKHLKGLVEQVTIFVGKLVTGALDIFNKFIVPIVNFLVKTLGPTFADIFSFIGDVIMTVVSVVVDVAKSIFKILGGIVDFIVGVFTGDWKKAWGGIKDIFSGIFDGVVAIFKGGINLIIDGLNFLIRSMNKIHFDIPDWVPGIGGKGFGINIPEIPKLAKGGLVGAPTLAMVGDNRNAAVDPEVVTPLSKLQDMLGASNQMVVEVLYMILDALERLDLSVDIDGERLTRVIRGLLNKENGRVGKSSVTVGGIPV